MLSKPIVSIIIPCYNHGQYIEDAISSIKACNTKTLYEIIIINDGSKDEYTLEILRKIEKQGFKVINQKNQGLAAARNNAIKEANGKYIIPLDSDNKLHKNYLDNAVFVLEQKPNIDVVYGNPILFGDLQGVKKLAKFNFGLLLVGNFIDACAVFRKEIWAKVGGYDGNMPAMGNEDWEFWINIYLNGGRFYHLNKPCFYYRVLNDSMSATTTRPNMSLNKEYIHTKHHKKIIQQLGESLFVSDYIRRNWLKAIIKLILKDRLFYNHKIM